MVMHLRTLLILAGSIALGACGGSDSPDGPTDTIAPIVNAGSDQSVQEGEIASLNATVIDGDTDDSALTYVWQQRSGPAIALSSIYSVNPSFTAPFVTQTQIAVLRLTVDDGVNEPVSDDVAITITDSLQNLPPNVDAGTDRNVVAGQDVTLDATVSDDNEDVSLTWTQISGPLVQLSDEFAEDPHFSVPDIQGNHVIVLRLTANDGVNAPVYDDISLRMKDPLVTDLPPTADAGPDQTVDEGSSVSLNGTASDDGSSLTILWQQISGPSIQLTDSNTQTPSFNAPMVAATQSVTLRLSVDDGVNPAVFDDVIITITDTPVQNNPPSVNAGADQEVAEGERVRLNATVTDDGDSTTLLWQQLSGPAVTLSSNNIENPSFSAPGVSSDAVVVLRLTADDGFNDPVSDDVRISISNISQDNPPSVNAGTDQQVEEGAFVALNAVVSDDGDAITLVWLQIAGPEISLSNTDTAEASFTAPEVDADQTVVLRLTANDGVNNPVFDDVSIRITNRNTPPIVNAGVDQDVSEGDTVSIAGNVVDDDEGLSMLWTQVSGPTITLVNPDQESLSFVAPSVSSDQTIVLRLTADDGVNPAVFDQVEIRVVNSTEDNPPTVNAGPDQNVVSGQVVTLAASANDDGEVLTLLWEQVSGPSVSLSATDSLTPSFTAPEVATAQTIVLRLTADDGANTPVSDEVSITVDNQELVVSAGDDQEAMSGDTVQLTALIEGTENPELSWSQISGPSVTLSDTSAAAPSFTAPNVETIQEIVLRITVESTTTTVSDELTVTVRPGADVNVSYAASAKNDALACYKGNGESECDLRVYQVMVESFIDGDTSADYNTGFGTSHHKGDIAGITSSLSYIKSLGMNAIWLTPVFYSDAGYAPLSATGYFATDYFQIDPNFGTLEKARELVETAHGLGLYVFFDGVFGHYSSNVHHSPSGRQPETDGTANYPNDLEFFQEVASYWIKELKIDGWRLDLAYEVPVQYWDDIRGSVEEASQSVTYVNAQGNTVHPLGYMVGEVWKGADVIADTAFGPEGEPALFSAFDFPMRYAALQTFAVEESGTGNQPASRLNSRFNADHSQFPSHAMPNLMITNHDLVRFGDLLQRGNVAQPNEDKYWDRHKLVHSFQAAYSGPITLYYGDEIGEEVEGFANKVDNHICSNQGLCDDHVSRTSGRIEGVATRVGDNPTVLNSRESDLKNHITALMQMRAQHPALYNGSRTHIYSDNDIYIDRKDAGTDNVLYLVNIADSSISISLADSAIGSQGELVNLSTEEIIERQAGAYAFTLPANSAMFLQISDPTAEGPQQRQGSNRGEGELADCNAPDVEGFGPLGEAIYIRGTYDGGSNFAATPEARMFSYKGDNIYQVVFNEPTTAFSFKFASTAFDYEFAVAGSADVIIGQTQDLAVASGPGSESTVSILEAGEYVYSFKVNEALDGGAMMVSQCP